MSFLKNDKVESNFFNLSFLIRFRLFFFASLMGMRKAVVQSSSSSNGSETELEAWPVDVWELTLDL